MSHPRSAYPLLNRWRHTAAAVTVALAGVLTVVLAATPAPASVAHRPAAFKMATLNVLGSQHTIHSRRYEPGTVRTRHAAQLLIARNVAIAGFQEVQSDQLRVLNQRLPGYRLWPNRVLGRDGLRLQIAFRTNRFTLLRTGSIITPFTRMQVPTPWVELRDQVSGRSFYVVTIHNSARGLEHERDVATRAEVALVDRLRATGRAVFLLGDANEHAEFFCHVSTGTDLVAANSGAEGVRHRDGSTSRSGTPRGCTPPAGYLPIDWILGSAPATFTRYHVSSGASVARVSDHSLVSAQVRLPYRRR